MQEAWDKWIPNRFSTSLITRALPKEVFDYYEGGALDDITLRENSADWKKLKLYCRVLPEVGPRDNRDITLPVMTLLQHKQNVFRRAKEPRPEFIKTPQGGEFVHIQPFDWL